MSESASGRELYERHHIIAGHTDAVLVNAEDRLVHANDAAVRLLRADSVEALLGTAPLDLVDNRYHDHVRRRMARVLEDGEIAPMSEYCWQRLDGSPVHVEVLSGPMQWEGAPAVLIIARDISRRKHDEEERERTVGALAEAKRAAERASEAKSQFLAVMSHELRTPLSAVIGCVTLLEEKGLLGPLTDDQEEAVSRIKISANHLAEVIGEILTFSRMEVAKESVQLEEVDLAWLVREVVSMLGMNAGHNQLVIRAINARSTVPIQTDPGKVRQILLNLVGNAVKYTREGRIEVKIDTAEPDSVRVHIRDTGPGIPPEDQERVFEPFTQLDGSHSRVGSGTGLGLAISRQFARLLGGDVTLQSTPGEGSTFSLRLTR